MKKRFSRIAGVIAACVIIALLLSYLTVLTVWKETYKEKGTFVDKAGDCDVLLFGNSRIRDSVFPMELWNEFGITSYNLGFPGTTVQTYYWALVNALDYADPELVVVDCCLLARTTEESLSSIQAVMAAFPFSFNKVRTALDIFPLDEYSFDDMFAVIWPFSKFHNRWAELEPDDFHNDKSDALGAFECVRSVVPEFDSTTPADTDYAKIEKSIDNMRRIAQLCSERGIKLVFSYTPHPATNTERWQTSVAEETAAELGVEFINFLDTDIVDYYTDMYDANSHLNISGARKLTRYLGRLLSEEYGLADHRGEAGYSSWDADYQEYLKAREQQLADETDLSRALLMLSYERYSSLIYIPAGSELFENDRVMKLIENAAGTELPKLRKAAESGEEYLLLTDRAAAASYEASGSGIYDGSGGIKLSADLSELSVGAQSYPLSVVGFPGDGDVRVFVFTPELEPVPECCHSFGLSADGAFARTDYFQK